MPYDINTTLERLEKNLSNLDSARKQVESMVSASNELQSTVENYVASINSLYDEVKLWEKELQSSQTGLADDVSSVFAQLKTSCEATTAAFQNSSDKIVNSFKSTSETSLTKFAEQNTLLASRVQELGALRQNVEKAIETIKSLKFSFSQIQTELKNSQKEEDQALTDLKQKVDVLPDNIKKTSDAIIEYGDFCFQKFNKILDETAPVITKIETEVSSLTQTASAIQSTCNAIRSSIEELKKKADATETSLQRSININRWLLVIGIVVLAIIFFMK